MSNDMFARKEMKQSFWRSCCLQGCNTYARQQGLGFGYSMIPFLKELYKDDKEAYAKSLLRHTELFNITYHKFRSGIYDFSFLGLYIC